MKLLDTNVWLALTLSGHEHHDAAHDWLRAETSEGEALFCRSTQQSFLRLLTTAAVFKPYGIDPLTNEEAWSIYEKLLSDGRIAFADEPPSLEERWNSLASCPVASPKHWMDAYLAAFAISGGYRLVTIDTTFKKFDGLDLMLLA